MSYHARMLPTTEGVVAFQHDTRSVVVRVAPLAPDDTRDASTDAGDSRHDDARPHAPPNAPNATPDAVPDATPWQGYRREPWLVVALASFVPIAVGFALPQQYHYLVLGLAGVLVVLSMAMLIRQGPSRARPARPEAGG